MIFFELSINDLFHHLGHFLAGDLLNSFFKDFFVEFFVIYFVEKLCLILGEIPIGAVLYSLCDFSEELFVPFRVGVFLEDLSE